MKNLRDVTLKNENKKVSNMGTLINASPLNTLIFGFFCLFSLIGCATAPSKNDSPDWLDGQSTQYSNTNYLTGRGAADLLAVAQDRARTDIAKIFQVALSEQSSDTSKFTTRTAEGHPISSFDASISRIIKSETNQLISGIQIADTWRDPENNRYHVLAILARTQAKNRLSQDINQLDLATNKNVGLSQNATDPLIKVSYASNAIGFLRQRNTLQSMLRIVDRTGQGIAPKYELGVLVAELDRLLKKVSIRSEVGQSNIDQHQVASILAAALSGSGFLAEKGSTSDFLVRANINLSDLGKREGWYWLKGAIEIQLTDTTRDKIRGAKRWEIKTSGQQKILAQQRAVEKIDKILQSELRQTLLEFALAK